VINRGNYRSDVFGSVGAAQAFEQVLGEACENFKWVLHAYVLMRNHFHLALETPEPNLVEGMHWLQSTYATRFNRFRGESGHLFQGRYQSLLIEDSAALVRVVDYVHLNPVRAGIVPIDQIGAFRWSSLGRLRRKDRPQWLVAKRWLAQLGLADEPQGWSAYVAHLQARSVDTDEKRDHAELCRGWAIGTAGWRAAVAKDHRHLALHVGIAAQELRELKHARWEDVLAKVLREAGRDKESLATALKGADWKCELAERLRREAGASNIWIAKTLHMGSPASVRSWLCRRRKTGNQQTAA
jgi:REP element-mobilizing transposase RayT